MDGIDAIRHSHVDAEGIDVQQKEALVPHKITTLFSAATKKGNAEYFSKKYEALRLPDFCNDAYAKAFVSSIVDALRQDPLFDQAINAWHIAEQKKQNRLQVPLVDLLANWLSIGTCYGEAMTILELVDKQDRSTITEDVVHQKLSLKASIHYQILNYLDVFVRKGGIASLAKQVEEKIAKSLPSHMKRNISSEVIPFARLKKEDFVGRLSDFLRQDVKGSTQEMQENDYLICVTFAGSSEIGHGAVIYYSPAHKRYFWYDPSTECGLYSTSDHSNFLAGVADKILEKRRQHINRFRLTAYRL